MKFNFNAILNVLLVVMIVWIAGRYFYLQPGYTNGESAPGFEASLISGETMSLADLRGKYVLLDFWGSWCGPCRAQNPDLVKLFEKYHNTRFKNAEGFEIVSVAIEQNESSWRRAIDRDGLDWPYHILSLTSSMKFFDSEIAQIYGVKRLPTSFLINEKGVIIGVDLSPSKIDKMLAENVK